MAAVESASSSVDGDVVLVTGFGPFGNHKINASWEAVRVLDGKIIDGVRVVTRHLDVAYDTVLSTVPKLWDELKPIAVIHCGVGHDGEIHVEKLARRADYSIADVSGCTPASKRCDFPDEAFRQRQKDSYECRINCHEIADAVRGKELKCEVSCDAGKYLCEFTYYVSMCFGDAPSVFVHVPSIGKPYPIEALSAGVEAAVESVVKQSRAASKQHAA